MAGMTVFGNPNMKPGASTPEGVAQEYFVNRQIMGNFASKPLISRWRPDQRKRFEVELARLEKENHAASELAMRQAGERPVEAQVVQT